jgi:hypothetical protein
VLLPTLATEEAADVQPSCAGEISAVTLPASVPFTLRLTVEPNGMIAEEGVTDMLIGINAGLEVELPPPHATSNKAKHKYNPHRNSWQKWLNSRKCVIQGVTEGIKFV